MKHLLKNISRKLGLLEQFNVELTVSAQTVKDKLSKKTDGDQPDLFDIFTVDKKEYKGVVTTERLEIKKRKRFPLSFEHLAEAAGQMKMENDKLIVSGEVKGIQLYLVIIGYGLTASLFVAIALVGVISTLTTGTVDGIYAAFAVLAFGAIFLGLPILFMRWSVRNLKTDLEEELRNIKE